MPLEQSVFQCSTSGLSACFTEWKPESSKIVSHHVSWDTINCWVLSPTSCAVWSPILYFYYRICYVSGCLVYLVYSAQNCPDSGSFSSVCTVFPSLCISVFPSVGASHFSCLLILHWARKCSASPSCSPCRSIEKQSLRSHARGHTRATFTDFFFTGRQSPPDGISAKDWIRYITGTLEIQNRVTK